MPVLISQPNQPVASSVNNSSITLQQVVNSMRAYSELVPVLGASGWTQEPAITIANDVMSKIIAQNFNWKWNRAVINPFLTVSLQQDYVSNVTNMGWFEQGWRIDINNTSLPKPVFAMETVRDLARTAFQGSPFNVSWIPNRLAIMGTWQANTSYPSGLNQPFTPASPFQQFIDQNGNILYITTNGTSGNTAPFAAVNASPGTLVTDNTITWTVADPNGIAIRLAPLPATSGIVWQIVPVYQIKAPVFTSLQQTIAPIPDDYAYLFRQGFMAMCKEHAGSRDSRESYAKWEESLFTALRQGDRERDETSFYPSESIAGGFTWNWTGIGPAFPYDYFGGVW